MSNHTRVYATLNSVCDYTLSNWSDCSAECNGGTQSQWFRLYSATGKTCSELRYFHRACNTHPCNCEC
ncbi:MAG: hypothetical protein GY739_21535 [Mesoflavibacter sp.]|nr:hypothetical protein [Mesoflavibacter sp.]